MPTQSTCLYYGHDNEASKCVNMLLKNEDPSQQIPRCKNEAGGQNRRLLNDRSYYRPSNFDIKVKKIYSRRHNQIRLYT
jgi:hypothetical protein